jgi:hypothetical protein
MSPAASGMLVRDYKGKEAVRLVNRNPPLLSFAIFCREAASVSLRPCGRRAFYRSS